MKKLQYLCITFCQIFGIMDCWETANKILFIEFFECDISYFRGFPLVTQLSRFKCNLPVIQKFLMVALSGKYGISMKYIFIDLLTTGKIETRFQSQFVRKRD